jgi:hypothetical protein
MRDSERWKYNRRKGGERERKRKKEREREERDGHTFFERGIML